jgi:light-regulated signal transduction histidine kinase (bacteriophytochrome)
MEVRIIRHGDGAIRWIAARGKLFRDAAGEPAHLMGSVMDVTERREAEERLRERTLQLESVNEALGSFTYSVSHDLRAPLRAIDGYAHILAEEHAASLTDESRRVLDVIRTNARQMGRLIDDLLTFSRVGRAAVERAPTDLAAMARAVADDLHRADPERRVTVEVGVLPPVTADAGMVRQVLTNLLGNAWKFTRGRDDATIRVGCVTHDDEPVYFVADDGAGFDMRYAGKLFGVFERLHHPDEFEGTGVGLAIVQRVVQRHGGRVWAEGEVGRGATFYFTLPNGKGAQHGYEGTNERGDPVGRGQPDGRRADRPGAPEA